MKKINYAKRILIGLCITLLILLLFLLWLMFQQINQNIHFSQADAEELVLERYGGYIRKSEVDYDGFSIEYEITIESAHGERLEVVVHGNSGMIIEVDEE